MKKLGIIVSHPIQYYAPLFRKMAENIELVVFYGHNPDPEQQGKSGFGEAFTWDVDLLSGYKHKFLNNIAHQKDFGSFKGIDVPDIGNSIKIEGCSHILILGWQYKFYLQTLFYCKWKKIPVAVRGDSQLGTNRNVFIKLSKLMIYPFFLKMYTKILYVGKRNKAYLKYFLVSEKKLAFSPHSVDQEFWKSKPIAKKKENLFFEFLWVGKFIDKKRPYDAIKAFLILKQSTDYNIRLTMVGTGELLGSCIKQANGENSIDFKGFNNNLNLLNFTKKRIVCY